jgi:adenylate cyclase
LLAFLWLANNPWRDVLIKPLETKIWDQYQRWGMDDTTHVPSVVIIDIDDATLKQEQSDWPLPHKKIADLAQYLFEKYSVAAVAFDMVFPKEQDPQASRKLLQLAQQYPLIFSQALNFDQKEQTGYLSGDMEVELQLGEKQTIFPKALGYAANFAALAEHHCIGNISVILDHDGLLRHVPSWVEWQGKYYPNLSLQILRCISEMTQKPVLQKYQQQYYRLDAPDMGIELLLEEQGLLRIPYRIKVPYHNKTKDKQVATEDYAHHSDYQVIPAHYILSQSLDQTNKEVLAGSIVLIGSSAFGTNDAVATPVASSLLGVVVHAQLLDWMLGGNQAQDDWMVVQGSSHLAPITWIYTLMWLWIVVTLLSLWGLLKKNHVVMALLFVLAMAVAWGWIGYYFWLVKQWWIPVLPFWRMAFLSLYKYPWSGFLLSKKPNVYSIYFKVIYLRV